VKIGIYTRVSTEDQAERNTVVIQLEALRRMVPDGIEYVDDGVSGKVPLGERPANAQLLRDAKAKKINEAVVYKLDRLGRSLRGILTAYDDLTTLGVSFRSATKPIDTSTVFGRAMFHTRKGTKRFNLLAGKVRCLSCGSTFVVTTRKRDHTRYRCASQNGLRASTARL
jgi:DNA invertase Pin-like site-specific DNA recombinase